MPQEQDNKTIEITQKKCCMNRKLMEIPVVTARTISDALPDILRDKFEQGGSLCTAAVQVAHRFEDWFSVSGIPFFRNYTDHSFRHCLEVFATAIEFISDEAVQHVSSSDIAILLSSSCCHDAGMHLTEKQFLKLIQLDEEPLSSLDTISWKQLWADFFQDARRFNHRKLVDIFGDTRPVAQVPASDLDFSNRDKLLVGEFLRRNHPRLAHDIALGLGTKLGLGNLMEGMPQLHRDMIGLIARSHGAPLRDLLDYVVEMFDIRDFQGIHIVYLMVLLRTADYAQIQPSRAPLIHTQVHNVTSPISAREWRVHQCVRNINNTHTDPESIFIDARPENVIDYARTRSWLEDLQKELDTAWAVLGEVYGRHKSPPLDMLTLKVRRIRSSILDGTRDFGFYPEILRFRVAESEMLSLLLAPLYGDHPMYGLRELIQNARDATTERNAVQPFAERPAIKIRIDLSTTTPTLEVSDDGIGMNIAVIRGYFLNAGASYRASDQWRAEHLDQDGKSKIVRSGRFGVGALAAFLIGTRIEVTTRTATEPSGLGLHFSCSLEEEAIEVKDVPTEIGTTIRISSDKEKVDSILDIIPHLKMLFEFEDVDIDVEITDASGNSVSPEFQLWEYEEWERINFSTPDFDSVVVKFTTRDYRYGGHRGKCFVNGIAVARYSEHDFNFGNSIYPPVGINTPIALPGHTGNTYTTILFDSVIYVEDKDAKVKINLARTEVGAGDAYIEARIGDHLAEKYVSELTNAVKEFMKQKKWGVQRGWFHISPESLMIVKGDILPNDSNILKLRGAQYIAKFDAEPLEMIDVSRRHPDVAMFPGSRQMSPADAMNFFRDLRYEASETASSSAIFMAPKIWLDKIAGHKAISNWIRNDIRNAQVIDHFGVQKSILRFGQIDPQLEIRFNAVMEYVSAEFLELYTDRNQVFHWKRFNRYEGEIISIISERWGARSILQ